MNLFVCALELLALTLWVHIRAKSQSCHVVSRLAPSRSVWNQREIIIRMTETIVQLYKTISKLKYCSLIETVVAKDMKGIDEYVRNIPSLNTKVGNWRQSWCRVVLTWNASKTLVFENWELKVRTNVQKQNHVFPQIWNKHRPFEFDMIIAAIYLDNKGNLHKKNSAWYNIRRQEWAFALYINRNQIQTDTIQVCKESTFF